MRPTPQHSALPMMTPLAGRRPDPSPPSHTTLVLTPTHPARTKTAMLTPQSARSVSGSPQSSPLPASSHSPEGAGVVIKTRGKARLLREVVLFWKSRLNDAVRQLQALVAAMSVSSEAPFHGMEHDAFMLLCAVEESLQRIYQGSELFYRALAHDPYIPVPAICQLLALLLFTSTYFHTFSQMVWRAAMFGKVLELIRLVAGVPSWGTRLSEEFRCSPEGALSVLDLLSVLASAGKRFIEEGSAQPHATGLYMLLEQPGGHPYILFHTCEGVAQELVANYVQVQELLHAGANPPSYLKSLTEEEEAAALAAAAAAAAAAADAAAAREAAALKEFMADYKPQQVPLDTCACCPWPPLHQRQQAQEEQEQLVLMQQQTLAIAAAREAAAAAAVAAGAAAAPDPMRVAHAHAAAPGAAAVTLTAAGAGHIQGPALGSQGVYQYEGHQHTHHQHPDHIHQQQQQHHLQHHPGQYPQGPGGSPASGTSPLPQPGQLHGAGRPIPRLLDRNLQPLVGAEIEAKLAAEAAEQAERERRLQERRQGEGKPRNREQGEDDHIMPLADLDLSAFATAVAAAEAQAGQGWEGGGGAGDNGSDGGESHADDGEESGRRGDDGSTGFRAGAGPRRRAQPAQQGSGGKAERQRHEWQGHGVRAGLPSWLSPADGPGAPLSMLLSTSEAEDIPVFVGYEPPPPVLYKPLSPEPEDGSVNAKRFQVPQQAPVYVHAPEQQALRPARGGPGHRSGEEGVDGELGAGQAGARGPKAGQQAGQQSYGVQSKQPQKAGAGGKGGDGEPPPSSFELFKRVVDKPPQGQGLGQGPSPPSVVLYDRVVERQHLRSRSDAPLQHRNVAAATAATAATDVQGGVAGAAGAAPATVTLQASPTQSQPQPRQRQQWAKPEPPSGPRGGGPGQGPAMPRGRSRLSAGAPPTSPDGEEERGGAGASGSAAAASQAAKSSERAATGTAAGAKVAGAKAATAAVGAMAEGTGAGAGAQASAARTATGAGTEASQPAGGAQTRAASQASAGHPLHPPGIGTPLTPRGGIAAPDHAPKGPPAVSEQTSKGAPVVPEQASGAPVVPEQASKGAPAVPEQAGGVAGAEAPMVASRGLFGGLGNLLQQAAQGVVSAATAAMDQAQQPSQPSQPPQPPQPPQAGVPPKKGAAGGGGDKALGGAVGGGAGAVGVPAAEGDAGAGTRAAGGRKRAVLVGCNYPGTQAALEGCVNDAYAVQDMLVLRYGFRKEDIVMMLDNGDTPAAKPTGANMKARLAEMVRQAQDGDVLVFHFSGHGTQVPCRPGDKGEADGKDEAICPCDLNVIVDNDLRTIFQPLHDRPNVKLTFLADCCHSGTLLDHEAVQISGPKAGGPAPPSAAAVQATQNMLAGLGAGGGTAGAGKKDVEISRDAAASGPASGSGSGFGPLEAGSSVRERNLPFEALCQILSNNAGGAGPGGQPVTTQNFHSALGAMFGPSASSISGMVQGAVSALGGLAGLGGLFQPGGQPAPAPVPAPAPAPVTPAPGNPTPPHPQQPAPGPKPPAKPPAPAPGAGAPKLHPDIGILITGCQDHETSADVRPAGGKAHGAFTNAMVSAVQAHQAANAAGVPLTNRNLVIAIRQALAHGKFSQSPSLECSSKWTDTAFIVQ